MVVTLSVDAGSTLATHQLQFKLHRQVRVICVHACVGGGAQAAVPRHRPRRTHTHNTPPPTRPQNSKDGVCPCGCDYASDRDCPCRDLARELTVTVTKSRAMASYPLTYLQSFNYKPVEGVVRPGPGMCRDGAYDAAPTCGWFYVGGGKIADSQGFCCSCDAKQVWDDTFGAASRQRTCVFLFCFLCVWRLQAAAGGGGGGAKRLTACACCVCVDAAAPSSTANNKQARQPQLRLFRKPRRHPARPPALERALPHV